MPPRRTVAGKRTALYRLYSSDQCLLYVGIAVNPPARWTSHALDKRWWTDVVTITIAWYDTWELAEAAEVEAIQTENPLHNVANAPVDEMPERLERSAKHKLKRQTDLRNIRLPQELWERFGEACARNGTNRTVVLRQFMRWYVYAGGAAMPQRPEADVAGNRPLMPSGSGEA